MNKNLLMLVKARKLCKKMMEENPEMEEDEVIKRVVQELYGEKGEAILEQVKLNPQKYTDVLKNTRHLANE